MEFSIELWISAMIPIILLLFTISYLKIKSTRAALISLITALVIAVINYKLTFAQLGIAIAKGVSLSLYVILIIMGAIFLYNVAKTVGAFEVIRDFMLNLSGDKLLQILALAWAFSSFIQGISGFGVPVAVIGSLMVGMGFDPLIALSAVLIGHSWAVGFGSMGSTFYALSLVTGLEPMRLGLVLSLLFYLPIITTGLAVAHLQGGLKAVKSSLKYVLPIGLLMGSVQLGVVKLGFPHLASLLGGLSGSIFFLIILNRNKKEKERKNKNNEEMSIGLALLPYFILIGTALLSQIPLFKNLLPEWQVGFYYPGFTTLLGYQVRPEEGYAAIELFSHPVTFLLLAGVLGILIYLAKGFLASGQVKEILQSSYQQGSSSSLTVLLLMIMALVMNDSGMLYMFAQGLIEISNTYFPIISPFIGILGAFLTGSTTSSNVLFGGVQTEVAELLELSPYLIAANQAVGASLGSAVAPAKILLGVSTVGALGLEGRVLKLTLGYTLISSLVMGMVVYLII
ncbi:L-lactate permease [Natroniella sulfidigena]|uniref:L-lactate permease n=1 Tax=Natroniella sulfidigena TaxID=723921 RepID=UPI00200ABDF4|nr:L-lactate permease [Natroniella sulfidigena]MCK8817836.1 L-lactate permease [Natroniella sulfidigena]